MPNSLPPIDIMEQGIYNAPDEDDICLICHDVLNGGEETSDNNPPYTLECKHKYHANCIITWFRSGHSNCPYCGDLGSNAPKKEKKRNGRSMRRSMYRSWAGGVIDAKYERMRQYSRRNDAPDQLVKMINKLKDIEEEFKNSKEELNSFIDTPTDGLTWKDMNKERCRLREKMWKANRKISEQKCVISSYPIIPLIIPKIIV